MTRGEIYEYMVVEYDPQYSGGSISEKLTKLGAEGWKIISTAAYGFEYNRKYNRKVIWTLERKVEE